MTQLHFPKDFLWGAATSAHQIEGHTLNDWSEWEKENALRLAHEAEDRFGHLPSWKDIEKEATNPNNYISGNACDHYHLYEQDFDIAKSLGHNAHRFSIEWSRIEPTEGKFDESEIEHYKKVVQALRTRGIEPFVTLWHWSNPLWIRDRGDWSNTDTINYYARYVEKMVQALGDITFWIPINEPNIHTTFAYIKGTQPPGKKNIFTALQVFHNILKGHKKAYEIIHKHSKNAQVGMANSIIFFDPKNNFFLNKIAARIAHYFWNLYAIEYIKKQSDFIGVNYYTRSLVGLGSKKKQAGNTSTDLGWEIYPKGIYDILKNLSQFKLPLYITENGLADSKDLNREKFIKDHLSFVYQAIKEGANVRGYFYWSFLDNNEFVELRGFWPRFGLVAVDYATQERAIRPSAYAYAKICKENAIEI